MISNEIWALGGKIVTMNAAGDVYPKGYLLIKDNRILDVVNGNLPDKYKTVEKVETGSVIYPGLIDLHNHFVYNVLPLWVVPEKYTNRSQWPRHKEYSAGVSQPMALLTGYADSSKAIVRYIEAKAIIGGTTTGQGIMTQIKGDRKIFDGAMRNVENPMDPLLLSARTKVPDLNIDGEDSAKDIESFRKGINMPGGNAYFYHLSEGNDDFARTHFENLKKLDLINQNLVGIHSLGLRPDDLHYFAAKQGKIVWSPFSNTLLYGNSLDLNALKSSGLLFSIGCDWSPSGSKNLLQELKVAYYENKKYGFPFSNAELVAAVTSYPAKMLRWDQQLGSIAPNHIADLTIVADHKIDPYENLIFATEKDINLVLIDGIARYGNTTLMNKFTESENYPAEQFKVNGADKKINLYIDGSKLNHIGFLDSAQLIRKGMLDLEQFKKQMDEQALKVAAFEFDTLDGEPDDFQLVLDNEHEDHHMDLALEGLDLEAFVKPPMQNSIAMDEPIAFGEAYWNRVSQQKNISDELKLWLAGFYV